MTKTPKHLRTSRRGRRLLAGAGLVLSGAALAAVATAVLPGAAGEAQAATHNYVLAANPDAVSGVLLDEEVSIQFATAVLAASVGPDTILVRTGFGNTEQARGTYVVGAFMYDRSVQRRAVIRPEAIQEYYELVKGFARADAARAAQSLIARVESTGRLSLLRAVDQKLQNPLIEGPLAGTRLDDDSVYGIYPAELVDTTPNDNDDPLTYDPGDSPFEPFRTRIAGDDALWQAYLTGGDVNAFSQLAQNPEYERFYHALDPATGVPSATSVLRQRVYRRVLIDRRSASRVMFVPEIPIRADLADTGFAAGQPYALIIPSSSPGIFNTVLARQDRRPLLQTHGHDFSTWFNVVPATSATLFRAGEARTGISTIQKPRIINQTPPNGETFVDATTDWEDPDNQYNVPLPQRKAFSVRLRFAQALDPRTVSPTTFTISKVETLDSSGNDVAALVPPIQVPVGTFLNQHRLGIVEVEVTPATNLDPQSRYQIVARNLVASIGGSTNPTDYVASFTVGAGSPPLDAIREDFTSVSGRADPANPDTLGQNTTAYWPAPALFDTNASGKLVAAFMPFAGTGVGAPSDPRDSTTPIVTALSLTPGQSITFLTEAPDPLNPGGLGTPIEYNYASVLMQNAAAFAVGRYPLIIRSQAKIELFSSNLLVPGLAGSDGTTNTDLVNGGPTGGYGGKPGCGGFRGGDGGCAPMTDSNGEPVFSSSGALQFDQTKFNGSDGFPSYLKTSAGIGGGSGGFSGDYEAPNNVDCSLPSGISTADAACTPARYRESGGGGGHATAGNDGDGARGTAKTHTGGYYGGQGGQAFGKPDFSDQSSNGLFGTIGAPHLGLGTGGGGGGGGGAEDNLGTAGDGIANAQDSGGGGGGGGGGAVQLVARTAITIDSSVVDASGGSGGRTFNATRSDYGRGAPGGSGAGGSIWLQCYGDISIVNGAKVTAAGGDNSASAGYIQVNTVGADRLGHGGHGGDGYVRFEDSDGAANIVGSTVTPAASQIVFLPYDNPNTATIETDYQAFPGTPFVDHISQGFSKWINTQLDTPSFAPHDDDPSTPAIDGTSFYTGQPGSSFQSQVDIWVRSAPNDTGNNGHPNLFLATSSGNTSPWTQYVDVGTISRRRFLQFRVDFTMPFSYDWSLADRPYVDYIRIDINLN